MGPCPLLYPTCETERSREIYRPGNPLPGPTGEAVMTQISTHAPQQTSWFSTFVVSLLAVAASAVVLGGVLGLVQFAA